MFKWLAAAAAVAVALPLALVLLVAATADRQPGEHEPGRRPERPGPVGTSRPPTWRCTWPPRRPALACRGPSWPGIGKVESDHGQSDAPGVHSGANYAGAEGPMQFEPATFAQYAVNADPTAS